MVRVRSRLLVTSAQAGLEPRQDMPRCNQSEALPLCQTGPKIKSSVRRGVAYVFRSSAYVLRRLVWLLRNRCNDLHLHDGVHMGTVKRERPQ